MFEKGIVDTTVDPASFWSNATAGVTFFSGNKQGLDTIGHTAEEPREVCRILLYCNFNHYNGKPKRCINRKGKTIKTTLIFVKFMANKRHWKIVRSYNSAKSH